MTTTTPPPAGGPTVRQALWLNTKALKKDADGYYGDFVFASVVYIAAIVLMWLINIGGYRHLNMLFFFGWTAVFFWGLTPRKGGIAAGLGILLSQPSRRLLEDAFQGWKFLYRIIMALLWLGWATSGILWVIPWEWAPMAFWMVFAAGLFMFAAGETFQKNTGELAYNFSMAVGSIIIIIGLFQALALPALSATYDGARDLLGLEDERRVEETVTYVPTTPKREYVKEDIELWLHEGAVTTPFKPDVAYTVSIRSEQATPICLYSPEWPILETVQKRNKFSLELSEVDEDGNPIIKDQEVTLEVIKKGDSRPGHTC